MISATHLHPMLVHFPIALVVLGFIAESALLYFKKEDWLSKSGFYLLIVGTLSAIVTLLTGVFFTSEMTGSAANIQESHELFAWLTLGTLIVTSTVRIILKMKDNENANLKRIAFALYGMAAVFVSITGYYGGTLVYDYMMPL